MPADKFQPVRDLGLTAGGEMNTDAVVARLRDWDDRFGLALDPAEGPVIPVRFLTVPEDPAPLAAEVYAFCPDVVDQHFGSFWMMCEDADPAELPEGVAELIAGLDYESFEEEHGVDGPTEYGLELLRRALRLGRAVPLWWD